MDDLTDKWALVEEIGLGGQSEVWLAEDRDKNSVALKRVLNIGGAERELEIHKAISGRPNIMPILETGIHGEYLAIVMPRAEYSLENIFESEPDGLDEYTLDKLIEDLLNGLAQIQGTVVHRDIKPSNILWHEETWKISDFGISRLADVPTSNPTRKPQLSEAYASPEQITGNHATHKTDMHAFGIVAVEASTGKRPYEATEISELYSQILTSEPKYLDIVPSKYSSLLRECLLKAPQSRPTADSLIARINRPIPDKDLKGRSALTIAHEKRVVADQKYQRKVEINRLEEERRKKLFEGGKILYENIRSNFVKSIASTAPSAYVRDSGGAIDIRFGGELFFDFCRYHDNQSRELDGLPFDVVAYGYIGLAINKAGSRFGRAHSLWYCDAKDSGEYHWFDLSFWKRNPSDSFHPFSLNPDDKVALNAFAGVTSDVSLNRSLLELFPDQLENFIDEWSGWLAQSEEGLYANPVNFPEDENAELSWRRSTKSD